MTFFDKERHLQTRRSPPSRKTTDPKVDGRQHVRDVLLAGPKRNDNVLRMMMPLLLLVLSLAGVAAALLAPGLGDLLLLAGPSALASAILLLLGLRRHSGPAAKRRWIVIDGSNVMHWMDGRPSIEPVREVVDHLKRLGYTPGVMFDANAGYKLGGGYRHDGAFARLLGLPKDSVMVVDKGTPADPMILTAARTLGARIVSNDRFRDWAEAHQEVRDLPGHLIRGGYRTGKLWLDLPEAP